MTRTIDATIQDIVQINLALLDAMRGEEWGALSTLSPRFITAAEATIAHFQQATGAEKKDELGQLIASLQASEAEIVQRLQTRMQMLKKNIAKLQQSKAGCQQYAAQMPRRFG